MRVIKIGGRAQSDARLAPAIAAAWNQAPGSLCVVHGGGDGISELQRALGLEPTFAGGRRVTSEGDIDAVLKVIDRLPRDARVVVVGHEPHVSALLGRLLGTGDTDRLEFRKGGAALVTLPKAAANGGRLEWFVRPKILRKLA